MKPDQPTLREQLIEAKLVAFEDWGDGGFSHRTDESAADLALSVLREWLLSDEQVEAAAEELFIAGHGPNQSLGKWANLRPGEQRPYMNSALTALSAAIGGERDAD